MTVLTGKAKNVSNLKKIQAEAKKLKSEDKNLAHKDAIKKATANLKKKGF